MTRLGRRRAIGSAVAAGVVAPRAARAEREIVDSAGRRVRVADRVGKVFPAGPPAAILLYTLAPDLLAGWTSAIRAPERPFFPARWADLPEIGRLTGRGNTANVEAVLASAPDLVLDYGTINDTYASLADRVQEQTKLPYALVDGGFDAIPGAYRLLGELVDRRERAELLAGYAARTLAAIDARVGALPPERRPRVYYARNPNGLTTGLAGSINVEILDRVGARNVAAEAMGRGGLVNVSLEDVLTWDPPTLLTIDPNFFAAVRRDPGWARVAAVREGRIAMVPTLPFGWIDFPPSVNRLIGLRWLAGLLYPDLFPEDVRALASEFYALFYHRAPDDAQLDALLRDARFARP